MHHLRVQEDCTTSCVVVDEATKVFFVAMQPFNFTPIALSDVASFSNVTRLCGNSNSSSNQQHTKIDVLVINLTDSPSTTSTPLGSSKFGIDAPILSPPFNVLTPKTKINKMVL